MGRHNQPTGQSFFKKGVAGSTMMAMAVTPLLFLPSSSLGSTACSEIIIKDGSPIAGATAETLSNNVCQLSFTQNVNDLEIPSWVNKLSTVVVAGGGGSSDEAATGYGGGGGQFVAWDDLPLTERTLDLVVGAMGGNYDTTLTNGGNSSITPDGGSALMIAKGGFAGGYGGDGGKAYQYVAVANNFSGASVSGDTKLSADGLYGTAGAGTFAGADYPVGGTGISIQTVVEEPDSTSYLDQDLWDIDSAVLGSGISLLDTQFGVGGSISTSPSDAVDGTGRGSQIKADKSNPSDAGSGIIIMRFWLNSAPNYVTFNTNGGSGSMVNQSASTSTDLTSNAFTRTGYTFSGWNTAADGSGTTYLDGVSYAFDADLTLYAQWTADTPPAPPAPAPYTGPLPVKLDTVCVPSTGGSATLSGQRLSGITAATVDGKAVTVSDATATSVKLAFPALEAGTYDVTYTSNSGNVTHQDSLRVCATGSTETSTETEVESGVDLEGAPERFYVYKRFSNYRGDIGSVVGSDRAAITAFVNANPGLTYVTCLGSTSGTPAIASDEALALARAKNACSIVEELAPGVTTRLATITGAGKGQFFRAVTLFGRGIN